MSSGTVDAGGTKVLLRHRKHRIVLSKCYERKILVYVVVVMFTCLILGKYPAANVKKGYSQMGNELLTKRGWIFLDSISGPELYTSYSF